MGDILDMAIADARSYLSGGFSTPLTFTTADQDTFVIEGFASIHSQGYDENGIPIVAENSHILISESEITDLGYQTRDSNNKVNIQEWKVSFQLSGITYNCKIAQPEPDHTLNVIRCQLRNY